jgi:hypothetical protein
MIDFSQSLSGPKDLSTFHVSGQRGTTRSQQPDNIDNILVLADISFMRRKESDERERQIIRSFREHFSKANKSGGRGLLKEDKAFTSSPDLEYWMNLAEKVARLRKQNGFDA